MPRRETKEDLLREEEVAKAVLELMPDRWDWHVKLEENAYGLDYGLFKDGKMTAALEVKVRTDRYRDLFIGLQKVMRGHHYSLLEGIQPLVVFRLPAEGGSGHDLYIRGLVPAKTSWISWGGRTDRGVVVGNDQEPMIHWPFPGEFKKLNEEPLQGMIPHPNEGKR